MKAVIYNQEGKETGQIALPKQIFGVPLNADLLHQVVVSQMANRRQVLASTKGRGEVRGGGKKPWAQKGTGRARHGSIRSPLWKGGGVTFGPTKERVFKKKINKKMNRKALFMVLSEKAKKGQLILFEKLELKTPKTKELFKLFRTLPLQKQSSMLVLPAIDRNLILAARNIPKLKTMQAVELNALDVLAVKYLLMPKSAVKIIENTFTKLF